AIPSFSQREYRRLRTELADLFDIRGSDFTVRDLLSTPYSRHSPAPENYNARVWASWTARMWGGRSGGYRAGTDAPSEHASNEASGGASSDGAGGSGGP